MGIVIVNMMYKIVNIPVYVSCSWRRSYRSLAKGEMPYMTWAYYIIQVLMHFVIIDQAFIAIEPLKEYTMNTLLFVWETQWILVFVWETQWILVFVWEVQLWILLFVWDNEFGCLCERHNESWCLCERHSEAWCLCERHNESWCLCERRNECWADC